MSEPRLFGFRHHGELASFKLHPPFGASLEAGTFHEHNTSLAFLELLRPGDTVVDVGANIGYYSLLSFAAMRGTGRILSFEPNPVVFSRLARNIALNQASCVTAFNVAASSRTGVAEILMSEGDSGLSRLIGTGDEGKPPAGPIASCATVRLDDIVADMGIETIRILKMDVEGHEAEVIRGAGGLLVRRVPEYVVCEINRSELIRNGCSELTLRKTFDDIGYEAELINPLGENLCDGKARAPYPFPLQADTPKVFNILFRRV